MTLYPRRELPANIRIHTAGLRAEKEKKERLPRWLENDDVRNRILRVYAMYIARHTLPEIMETEKISVPQIYKDLGRARQMRKLLFMSDIEHMLMEQVEARRAIIREARKSLEDVRAGMVTNVPSREDEEDTRITEATPQRARAEADLLRVISENEKAIEELVGLRDRERRGELPELPSAPPTQVTLVVDARTQTLIPKTESKVTLEKTETKVLEQG